MTYHQTKNQALNLRNEGYSYTHISKVTGVAKSTLSNWLTDVPYQPNKTTLEIIGRARIASNLAKHKQKEDSIFKAKKEAHAEIGKLTSRDVFMLGLGVYLGEGSKSHNIVRVVNANPDIILLSIRWFKYMGLKTENFALRVHLYPDSDIEKCLEFWSQKTNIPRAQFHKTQIDVRQNKSLSKQGKLPFGTAHLCIKSNGDKGFGTFLSRKINAWIDEVTC